MTLLWIFLLGLGLIIIAIFGGGIEVKEIKVPPLPTLPRLFSFMLGLALIVVSYWPNFLPSSLFARNDKPVSKQYAGALPIFYTKDQLSFAHTLYDYLASKKNYNVMSLGNTLTDFSEIVQGDHERAGTIRIVYKTNDDVSAEKILAGQMRKEYPSEVARFVESMDNNANVPLQIQLW